jgi:hypothetical protein
MAEEGGSIRPAGRWVSVRLQHRRVSFADDAPSSGEDAADEQSVSYSGIVITSYEGGALVAERWLPLGVDPSEADDEALIEQLREALLWQAGRPPQAAGE